jgi:phage terminase Nu1 subunit (DNA packaging protein)
LSERRIRQLRDEEVMKPTQGDFFELIPAVQAYIEYLKSGDKATDYNAERSKLVRAKRMNEELDLQIKSHELHSAAVVEQVVSDMLVRFKARMMSIPSKVSPQVSEMTDKNDISDLIKKNIDEALMELSDFKTAMEVCEDDTDAEKDD